MESARNKVRNICKWNTHLLSEVEIVNIIFKWQKDIDELTKVKNLVKPDVSGQFSFADVKMAFDSARLKKGNVFSKYTPPRITDKYADFEAYAKENFR